jgi:predicted  nucleic acid-binding Zn-ribbon protein
MRALSFLVVAVVFVAAASEHGVSEEVTVSQEREGSMLDASEMFELLQEGEGALPKTANLLRKTSREAITKAIMVATQEKSRVDGELDEAEESYRSTAAAIHRLRVDEDAIGKIMTEVSANHNQCQNRLLEISDQAKTKARKMRKDKAALAKATARLKVAGDKRTQVKMKAAAGLATLEASQAMRHKTSVKLEAAIKSANGDTSGEDVKRARNEYTEASNTATTDRNLKESDQMNVIQAMHEVLRAEEVYSTAATQFKTSSTTNAGAQAAYQMQYKKCSRFETEKEKISAKQARLEARLPPLETARRAASARLSAAQAAGNKAWSNLVSAIQKQTWNRASATQSLVSSLSLRLSQVRGRASRAELKKTKAQSLSSMVERELKEAQKLQEENRGKAAKLAKQSAELTATKREASSRVDSLETDLAAKEKELHESVRTMGFKSKREVQSRVQQQAAEALEERDTRELGELEGTGAETRSAETEAEANLAQAQKAQKLAEKKLSLMTTKEKGYGDKIHSLRSKAKEQKDRMATEDLLAKEAEASSASLAVKLAAVQAEHSQKQAELKEAMDGMSKVPKGDSEKLAAAKRMTDKTKAMVKIAAAKAADAQLKLQAAHAKASDHKVKMARVKQTMIAAEKAIQAALKERALAREAQKKAAEQHEKKVAAALAAAKAKAALIGKEKAAKSEAAAAKSARDKAAADAKEAQVKAASKSSEFAVEEARQEELKKGIEKLRQNAQKATKEAAEAETKLSVLSRESRTLKTDMASGSLHKKKLEDRLRSHQEEMGEAGGDARIFQEEVKAVNRMLTATRASLSKLSGDVKTSQNVLKGLGAESERLSTESKTAKVEEAKKDAEVLATKTALHKAPQQLAKAYAAEEASRQKEKKAYADQEKAELEAARLRMQTALSEKAQAKAHSRVAYTAKLVTESEAETVKADKAATAALAQDATASAALAEATKVHRALAEKLKASHTATKAARDLQGNAQKKLNAAMKSQSELWKAEGKIRERLADLKKKATDAKVNANQAEKAKLAAESFEMKAREHLNLMESRQSSQEETEKALAEVTQSAVEAKAQAKRNSAAKLKAAKDVDAAKAALEKAEEETKAASTEYEKAGISLKEAQGAAESGAKELEAAKAAEITALRAVDEAKTALAKVKQSIVDAELEEKKGGDGWKMLQGIAAQAAAEAQAARNGAVHAINTAKQQNQAAHESSYILSKAIKDLATESSATEAEIKKQVEELATRKKDLNKAESGDGSTTKKAASSLKDTAKAIENQQLAEAQGEGAGKKAKEMVKGEVKEEIAVVKQEVKAEGKEKANLGSAVKELAAAETAVTTAKSVLATASAATTAAETALAGAAPGVEKDRATSDLKTKTADEAAAKEAVTAAELAVEAAKKKVSGFEVEVQDADARAAKAASAVGAVDVKSIAGAKAAVKTAEENKSKGQATLDALTKQIALEEKNIKASEKAKNEIEARIATAKKENPSAVAGLTKEGVKTINDYNAQMNGLKALRGAETTAKASVAHLEALIGAAKIGVKEAEASANYDAANVAVIKAEEKLMEAKEGVSVTSLEVEHGQGSLSKAEAANAAATATADGLVVRQTEADAALKEATAEVKTATEAVTAAEKKAGEEGGAEALSAAKSSLTKKEEVSKIAVGALAKAKEAVEGSKASTDEAARLLKEEGEKVEALETKLGTATEAQAAAQKAVDAARAARTSAGNALSTASAATTKAYQDADSILATSAAAARAAAADAAATAREAELKKLEAGQAAKTALVEAQRAMLLRLRDGLSLLKARKGEEKLMSANKKRELNACLASKAKVKTCAAMLQSQLKALDKTVAATEAEIVKASAQLKEAEAQSKDLEKIAKAGSPTSKMVAEKASAVKTEMYKAANAELGFGEGEIVAKEREGAMPALLLKSDEAEAAMQSAVRKHRALQYLAEMATTALRKAAATLKDAAELNESPEALAIASKKGLQAMTDMSTAHLKAAKASEALAGFEIKAANARKAVEEMNQLRIRDIRKQKALKQGALAAAEELTEAEGDLANTDADVEQAATDAEVAAADANRDAASATRAANREAGFEKEALEIAGDRSKTGSKSAAMKRAEAEAKVDGYMEKMEGELNAARADKVAAAASLVDWTDRLTKAQKALPAAEEEAMEQDKRSALITTKAVAGLKQSELAIQRAKTARDTGETGPAAVAWALKLSLKKAMVKNQAVAEKEAMVRSEARKNLRSLIRGAESGPAIVVKLKLAIEKAAEGAAGAEKALEVAKEGKKNKDSTFGASRKALRASETTYTDAATDMGKALQHKVISAGKLMGLQTKVKTADALISTLKLKISNNYNEKEVVSLQANLTDATLAESIKNAEKSLAAGAKAASTALIGDLKLAIDKAKRSQLNMKVGARLTELSEGLSLQIHNEMKAADALSKRVYGEAYLSVWKERAATLKKELTAALTASSKVKKATGKGKASYLAALSADGADHVKIAKIESAKISQAATGRVLRAKVSEQLSPNAVASVVTAAKARVASCAKRETLQKGALEDAQKLLQVTQSRQKEMIKAFQSKMTGPEVKLKLKASLEAILLRVQTAQGQIKMLTSEIKATQKAKGVAMEEEEKTNAWSLKKNALFGAAMKKSKDHESVMAMSGQRLEAEEEEAERKDLVDAPRLERASAQLAQEKAKKEMGAIMAAFLRNFSTEADISYAKAKEESAGRVNGHKDAAAAAKAAQTRVSKYIAACIKDANRDLDTAKQASGKARAQKDLALLHRIKSLSQGKAGLMKSLQHKETRFQAAAYEMAKKAGVAHAKGEGYRERERRMKESMPLFMSKVQEAQGKKAKYAPKMLSEQQNFLGFTLAFNKAVESSSRTKKVMQGQAKDTNYQGLLTGDADVEVIHRETLLDTKQATQREAKDSLSLAIKAVGGGRKGGARALEESALNKLLSEARVRGVKAAEKAAIAEEKARELALAEAKQSSGMTAEEAGGILKLERVKTAAFEADVELAKQAKQKAKDLRDVATKGLKTAKTQVADIKLALPNIAKKVAALEAAAQVTTVVEIVLGPFAQGAKGLDEKLLINTVKNLINDDKLMKAKINSVHGSKCPNGSAGCLLAVTALTFKVRSAARAAVGVLLKAAQPGEGSLKAILSKAGTRVGYYESNYISTEPSDKYNGEPRCFHQAGRLGCNTHGKCQSSNVCLCDKGWSGPSCKIATCKGVSGWKACGGHGECKQPDQCVCHNGWGGNNCDEPVCGGLTQAQGACSKGKGTCTGFSGFAGGSKCECQHGYEGPTCAIARCDGLTDKEGACSGHGKCGAPNTCHCDKLWGGKDCTKESCARCSGHGACIAATANSAAACDCNAGYGGADCSVDSCGGKTGASACSGKGVCKKGVCTCETGRTGNDCQIKTCFGKSQVDGACSNRGVCVSEDKCVCRVGYEGPECQYTQCFGKTLQTGSCSGHGSCDKPDVCKCLGAKSDGDKWTGNECKQYKSAVLPSATPMVATKGCKSGWEGTDCKTPICPKSNGKVCGGHGKCAGVGLCKCDAGWTGTACGLASCKNKLTGQGACSGHGTCSGPDTCTCAPGYGGSECEQLKCSKSCENGGKCVAGDKCECAAGFGGPTCLDHICDGKSTSTGACGGNGLCGAKGKCSCFKGWGGAGCTEPVCSKGCGKGKCVAPETCQCEEGFIGATCTASTCFNQHGLAACSGRGTCDSPDKCTCNKGWGGSRCSIPLCGAAMTHVGPGVELIKGCGDDGTCIGPDTCKCKAGFFGPTCGDTICGQGDAKSCRGHGICNGATGMCKCDEGYGGEDCEVATCGGSDGGCNGRGVCLEAKKCSCESGWSGALCDTPVCDCKNGGTCTAPGICECKQGFGGAKCEEALCNGLTTSQGACSLRGTCDATDKCTCHAGWTGKECSTPVCPATIGQNDANCSSNGKCKAPSSCECNKGWTGATCSVPTCNGLTTAQGACSDRGVCQPKETCKCMAGWEGDNCDKPVCDLGCGNGKCVAPNTCSCNKGFTGGTCSQALCFGLTTAAGACSQNGICTGVDTCTCHPGYGGATCREPVCFGKLTDYCGGHGICAAPDKCECLRGWKGKDCREPICGGKDNSQGACSGHGRCTGDACECSEGWGGESCNVPKCGSGCQNGGTCKAPMTCDCPADFTGPTCAEPKCHGKSSAEGACNRKGRCSKPGQCDCLLGWKGSKCDQPTCDKSCKDSNGNGKCVGPNICGV